jgi:hypothetical protein
MAQSRFFAAVVAGMFTGALGGIAFFGSPRVVLAGNDRTDDFIICTGASGVSPRSPLDGVWLLDARRGKLLATIVDRSVGKTVGFAEVDLNKEFGLSPGDATRFVMTTGTITVAQAALYVAETHSGRFAVFTLGPSSDGSPGVTILRHDMTSFRRPTGPG